MVNEIIVELQRKGRFIPKYIVSTPSVWQSRLYVANQLDESTDKERKYALLEDIYKEKTFRYNKDIHGAYETYIEEKVKFLLCLAKLSIEVGKPPENSIPYIEEALVMLDGAESVHPYINPKEVSSLQKEIYSMIK
ncbi:MAG: hypothetical protein ATN33_06900 [Epulopiscium sp. Nele67-Bin001]|nr:MAG: hypothetical protein BEN18_07655 [Epulopiscium sp. Nuni2H_MBin001]OON92642.1 MAG: hypothetical protein ATN33_06900 [Epulopiscium sp. Nele67-Bin001]